MSTSLGVNVQRHHLHSNSYFPDATVTLIFVLEVNLPGIIGTGFPLTGCPSSHPINSVKALTPNQ